MKKPDDRLFLQHILESLNKIQIYVTDISQEQFFQQTLIQDAVIRQLEIVGEASKRLSLTTKENFPNIPWKDITGMRDKLIHDYFGVDIQAVWQTIQEDVSELENQINQILESF